MRGDTVMRRLLAALADSSPAFTPVPRVGDERSVRRLLSALADSAPAPHPRQPPDSATFSAPTWAYAGLEGVERAEPEPEIEPALVSRFAELPPLRRLLARDDLLPALDTLEAVEDVVDRVRRLRADVDDLEIRLTMATWAEPSARAWAAIRRDLVPARAAAQALRADLDDTAMAQPLSGIVFSLDQAVTHRLDSMAPDVMRDRAVAAQRDIARLIQVLDLQVHALCAGLNADFARATMSPLGLVRLHTSTPVDHEQLRETIGFLRTAINDMIGADLRELGTRSVPLRGVRWSAGTAWPPELTDTVHSRSVLVDPEQGIYEVQDTRAEVLTT